MPDSAPTNLFENIPPELPEELIEALLDQPGGPRIERIVSRGHASPAGFWYEQERAEFVVLLSGTASLRFADETEPRQLKPGDWLEIPAGRRHRVEATDTENDTVWLAVHF